MYDQNFNTFTFDGFVARLSTFGKPKFEFALIEHKANATPIHVGFYYGS